MQRNLKPAGISGEKNDSAFDAVRDLIAKEAAGRKAFIAPPPQPKRPLAAGLSHPALDAATPRQSDGMQPRMGQAAADKFPTLAPPESTSRTGRKQMRRRKSRLIPLKGSAMIAMSVGGIAAAVLLLIGPIVCMALIFPGLVVGGCLYVIHGHEGFWRGVLRPVRWYVARHPDRAGAVHRRIDRFALRWDMLLDRFPERLVAALYLPDVSDIAAVAEQDQTPIDLRLRGAA